MSRRVEWVSHAAAFALATFCSCGVVHAVTLNPGQSARINFASSTATGPFDFVTFGLDFSAANPFGTNETLKFSTFDANNSLLTSATVASGSSVYTSGLFGTLTENAIVPFDLSKALKTTSFYAIVTDVAGSFDLTGAEANFEHIFTSGSNQFGVEGTVSQTPLPAALPLYGSALAISGFIAWRRKRRAAAAVLAA